ncbi:hypothetical protein BU25DRAFT_407073 [Macroventuria anomochaeta]|uniref:Uncharacterized protein n=1 Tax=Macroventuria anomochaeta TaxID=301207 RepID=A0ACB6SBB4_9PLEO|nr:uncharacterized protein BU25DRAFT_407073 [Macroventuria anomochaeta]KAF2631421.1 hypothetical protein BU25DRAFT_407073 [Macroventuria anomochaeta]
MHSIRSRPICRAHNTFSPSIALWQHFVAPNQHFPQRQLKSSFTTEVTQSRDDENVNSNGEDLAAQLKAASERTAVFKKVRTEKGNYSLNWKLYPKYRDNGEQKERTSLGKPRGRRQQDAERLLIKAYNAYDAAQDYEGVVVQPIQTGVPVRESNFPWVPRNRESIKSAEERLELEIQAFHKYIRPNHAESIARKHVIEQVRQHVREILPGYVLEVFGSERTGIAFAGSDIDLRLVPQNVMSDTARSKLPPSPEERSRRRGDLRRLHQILMMKHKTDYLLPKIRWARYPLISLQDRASGLDIQVVLSNDTSVSREFMQRYMEEYTYLPQLYSVIKAILDVRGLSDVFRGGIGSYSLFMMIVASLKHRPHPRNDASGALLYFLRFWGTFKAEEHGISVEPAELFAKSEQVVMHDKVMEHIEEGKTAPLPPWMLTLRDPADETNDLGRKAIAWKHVQKTYRNLAERLRIDMAQNTRPSLLAWYVGPIYTLQQAHRKKLTEYGRSLATAGRKYPPVFYTSAQLVKTKALEADARAIDRKTPDLNELASIAREVRDGKTEAVDEDAGTMATPESPDFDELASIAQAIREGEAANKQSAREAEASDVAKEDQVNPWMKDIVGEYSHKETGEAFSNLLGLDKKRDANKREE